MTGAADHERAPLLPTMADDPEADRSLREALTVLRNQVADDDVRRSIDHVLNGTASLRDLARSPDFSAMVAPLAQRGYEHWEAARGEHDGGSAGSPGTLS